MRLDLQAVSLMLLFPALFSTSFVAEAANDQDDPVMHFDQREAFEAYAHIGIGVDSFASGETQEFLNPGESGGTDERAIAGFSFAYRLLGDRSEAGWRSSKLWVYGETVHGIRSSDVDCEENANFPTCEDALLDQSTPDQVLLIIRDSTSLEAFVGLRWEFHTLQPESGSPANLYLKTQAGFVSIADGPEDVSDLHHFGVGAIIVKGRFSDSYLEVGYGRNDLFAENNTKRWKLDAYLSTELVEDTGKFFFVQFNVDVDAGHGSDSVQTYFGVEFDLSKNPFNWKKPKS